ncbi:AQP8 [Mytilus edulis]|uniref:AQP8 n=1 Tax=Mytilus edulis TaxID=6550 RepID=A0A8S3QA64_MYTED|nr:AQP8 [Mytilus edulis]
MTEEKDNVANNNEIVVDVRQETPDEASKLSNLAKATFAEFLGTVIYVFLATNTQYYSISPALVLVGLIIIFRNISGAHFNPVITLAVRMSGNMEGSKAMILYSGFQLLGGMVGAALSRIVLPHDNYMAHNGGATTLSNTVEVPSAIACEAIITFVLVLTYLMSTLNKSNTHSVISPVAIGFVAWANIEAV